MFCVKCGNELPTAYTTNFCPNCGQAINGESKIAKYTSDGNLVNQTKGQEGVPSKVPTTDSNAMRIRQDTSKEDLRVVEKAIRALKMRENTKAPKASGIAEPIKYDTKYINKPSSGKGKAIGALVAIVIIAIIIAVVVNFFNQMLREDDKLLELGCTPEAWGSMGLPTIWSCPAWRDIDVNDPKTFMDQSPAGPN